MRLGVIGFPVGHSFSPLMHASALRALGLDWSYEAISVGPDHLAEFIEQLRSPEWRGVNVTLPHKETVLPLLDDVEISAREVGAANCVTNKGGRLVGSNTDVKALDAELDRVEEAWRGRCAWILGAGGAARACLAALSNRGVEVSIICRHIGRGEALTASVRHPGGHVAVRSWTPRVFREAPRGALIVNTTPVGMWPHTQAIPWPDDVPLPVDGFVLDLVYNPPITALIRRARLDGLSAINGIGMLIEQGAQAFETWTGRSTPQHVMRQAIEETMEDLHAEVLDFG